MSSDTIEIDRILDSRTFSTVQRLAVILAALAAIMDGFDGQLIGFAIPSILREWHVSREAFAPVVAAGLVGMALGSVFVGALADRHGRKVAIVCSIGLFGAATLAAAAADSIGMLTALRFLAGLGIGGALPCASVIAVEFSPTRMRTLFVTATVVCYPIGGIVAGLFAARVLPTAGWRGLFCVGGLLPLVVVGLLLVALPESPRFLVRRTDRKHDLHKLVSRMGGVIPEGASITDGPDRGADVERHHSPLPNTSWVWDSIALAGVFFMSLMAIYSAFSWLPTMLTAEGMNIRIATQGLTAYNVGGLAGALTCAVLVMKVGSRRALLGASLGALLSALLLLALFSGMTNGALIVAIGVHGFFANALQAPMYALSAHIYPPETRARGIGVATGFGRVGAIVSAFAGASVISAGGATAYFALLAAAMFLALVGIGAIQNHIPSMAH
ncbi:MULTISPECIES: MFS transporter [unclassified Burkholderia]|uniref:MFS transporter n=1 Tax=unclassified Burkholderia TaxID=2613784 RepID=UPI000F569566|nr:MULTISPECIES: MFS transporter [unclassified Burkholderia]RQR70966.1 MFS transporter [Burkholderia sp. Bp9011]RQR83699.1 MFS transporter [Burkholderia sp. Bp9010]RQS64400.1 MFS transporter [Burkholderia sp. Bp8977]